MFYLPRQRVSIREIMNQKRQYNEETYTRTGKRMANLPRDFFQYRPFLYRSLIMPSYVHGYSLAIEYMKKWFISKFPENYFKVIHVNGKHVLDDWKHFNNYNIKREKPMLAIVPTVEYDYDREQLDLYMADADLYLKRSNYQQSFLKDYKNNVFLAMQMRALRMNFRFKVRLNSRSEQLDLFNRMEIWFRVGTTQQNYLSADFHVPYEVMSNIATDLNFKVDPDTHRIINVIDFISYLNEHSDLPFIFKIRAINQKPEFFIRVRDLYTHISTLNKLELDDGERTGKLDTNYHVEMEATLTIPIPQFYVYFSQYAISQRIPVREDMGIGIYTINAFEIPPENKVGWGQYAQTSYLCEKGETYIDLSPIFEDRGNINQVIQHSIKNGVSPDQFIDVEAYYGDDIAKKVHFQMDYKEMKMMLDHPAYEEDTIVIAIYADKEYVNNTIITLENLVVNNRIEPERK